MLNYQRVHSCRIPTLNITLRHMAMDQYLYIPFLGGWTSINPSYFDVNYRGIGFWPIPISNISTDYTYLECLKGRSRCKVLDQFPWTCSSFKHPKSWNHAKQSLTSWKLTTLWTSRDKQRLPTGRFLRHVTLSLGLEQILHLRTWRIWCHFRRQLLRITWRITFRNFGSCSLGPEGLNASSLLGA